MTVSRLPPLVCFLVLAVVTLNLGRRTGGAAVQQRRSDL
jgi:hypothetical protein